MQMSTTHSSFQGCRLGLESRDVPTFCLEKNCQRLGLGRQTSLSRLGLGHLRLVPETNFTVSSDGQLGMQMAPYAVWTGFRRCKPMLIKLTRWKQWTWKITSRPVIAINKTCTLTSRSRLESYNSSCLGLVSRLVKPTSRSRLGLELLRLVPIPASNLETLKAGLRTVGGRVATHQLFLHG